MKAGTKAKLTVLIIAALLAGCSGRAEREALREEAIAYYEAGDYATALRTFNEALEASRGEVSDFSYDIFRYKAECELRTGDYDEARSSYEALLLLDDDDAHDRYYSAITAELDKLTLMEDAATLFNEGSYSEAASLYAQCAALDESSVGRVAWFNEAVCYEYMSDFDEASYLLSQYLEVYPEDEAAIKESLFSESRR